MASPSDYSAFFKNVTTSGTPEKVGASTVRANEFRFSGWKNSSTANTGNVKIRPAGGVGWEILHPETTIKYEAPSGGFFRADQFEIDADNDGDGVYVQTSSAVVYEGP